MNRRFGEGICGVLLWWGKNQGSIIILAAGLRAAPGSCGDQAKRTGLDLPVESNSRRLGTVGSA